MKDSKVRARQAQAAEAQARSVEDVARKVDLILKHLKIADVGPDPEADAVVDARAAESAGEATEEQQALLHAIPTREEAMKAQVEADDAAKKKAAIRRR